MKKSSSATCSGSLAGAVYTVYSDSACSTSKGTITIKTDGTSDDVLTLEAGTYYVKETTAPTSGWYIKNPEMTSVTVTAGTLTTTLTTGAAVETPYAGLQIHKLHNLSDSVAGAVFKVYSDQACSSQVGTLTVPSGSDYTNTVMLPAGTYYFCRPVQNEVR